MSPNQDNALSNSSSMADLSNPDLGEGTAQKKVVTTESVNTPAPGYAPLFLEGWLEFICERYGVRSHRICIGGEDPNRARLESVLFLDDRGRVRRPLRSPYMPIRFDATPSPYPYKIEHQWHELATQLAHEMRQRGVLNETPLAPNVQDVRPWQWSGYRINVNYTFYIDFPYDPAFLSKQNRSRIRKAERDGFRAERTKDLEAVSMCLRAAEVRQKYKLGISREDLELAQALLGEEHFFAYAVYAPNGDIAGATVSLHSAGSVAIGWLGGIREEHMSSGAMNLLDVQSYAELERQGATGLDLTGANIRSVASYKSALGARLVPYYSIEAYSARRLGKWVQAWFRYRRLQS